MASPPAGEGDLADGRAVMGMQDAPRLGQDRAVPGRQMRTPAKEQHVAGSCVRDGEPMQVSSRRQREGLVAVMAQRAGL